jgi:hypothetical protein
LAAGKRNAFFSDHRLITTVKFGDDLVYTGNLSSPFDFFFRCLRESQCDIGRNRFREQKRLLQNDSDMFAQMTAPDFS